MDVLGLGIQLCKRAKQLFFGLLDNYSGAAAAYSLRKLSRGYIGPLVKVRRDADNAEKDFTSTTSIADWVNGKQESTLPCDVATAAAAYSLRKVKAAYTGNALQVRRASDDVEVNVAFDANGEVSASSAITNIPVGNFPTSVAQNRTGAARYGTFTTDGLYSFSAIANAVALGGYVIDEGSVGDVVTVSFDLTLNSGSISSIVLRPALETGSDVSNLSGPISSSGSYSFDLTATDAYSVVAFIAVSANFTVSNVSIQVRQDAGDTTATTLGGFLTPQWKNVGYASFTKDEDWENGFTAFNSGGSVAALRLPSGNAGDSITISFDLTFNSGTPSPAFSLRDEAAGSIRSNAVFATTEGSGSATLIATGSYEFISISEFDVPSGFSLSNITLSVVPVGADAHVVTWYDQSGNGYDATQDTAGDQPKIASAGSLIADGINFFSGLNLELAGTGLDIFKNVSYGQIFSVIKPRETGTANSRYFEASIGTGSGARFLFGDGQDTAGTFRIGGRALDGDSFGDEESPTGHSNQLSLITGFLNYTDAEGFLFLNGAQVATGSIPNMTAGNTSDTSSQSVAIGGASAGDTAPFNAKELIIYASDQSANRFKIESNINNHYGIYTAAEDGFVNTWYDQSGNGNDATAPADTNEPKIVSAGSYLGELDFDGVDDQLNATSFSESQPITSFSVFTQDSVSSTIYGSGGTHQLITSSTNKISLNAGTALVSSASISLGVQTLVSALADSTSSFTFIDGGNATTGDAGTTGIDSPLKLGNTQSNRFMDGKLQEVILYNSDQSANRTAIESNIADEYGITLP